MNWTSVTGWCWLVAFFAVFVFKDPQTQTLKTSCMYTDNNRDKQSNDHNLECYPHRYKRYLTYIILINCDPTLWNCSDKAGLTRDILSHSTLLCYLNSVKNSAFPGGLHSFKRCDTISEDLPVILSRHLCIYKLFECLHLPPLDLWGLIRFLPEIKSSYENFKSAYSLTLEKIEFFTTAIKLWLFTGVMQLSHLTIKLAWKSRR